MKINLDEYFKKRRLNDSVAPKYRSLCVRCLQPEFGCYCSLVQEFDPKISFVVLIHPIEVRRRIATGRMSSLCLKNSHLIMGQDYTGNSEVQKLLEDANYHSMILYPGSHSLNLSAMNDEQKQSLVPLDKKLRIFVIDGTWATAKKMIRQSRILHQLPRICFTPKRPSSFRVRKQPKPQCYSTIEAIHETIEHLGESQGFPIQRREHDGLLRVFNSMVEKQLAFINQSELRSRDAARALLIVS